MGKRKEQSTPLGAITGAFVLKSRLGPEQWDLDMQVSSRGRWQVPDLATLLFAVSEVPPPMSRLQTGPARLQCALFVLPEPAFARCLSLAHSIDGCSRTSVHLHSWPLPRSNSA